MTKAKTITNAQALAAALELAKEYGTAELVAKLEHMHTQATKPRKAAVKRPSKARLQNEAAAHELHEIAGTEPFGTKFVQEHVKYVTSSQKASAVLQVAIELGLVAKTDNAKDGKAQYIRV